jgi:PAS domain S-box-containing protein
MPTIRDLHADHSPGLAPGGGQEEVLYQSERTRVVRVRLTDPDTTVVCKQPLGPGSVRRLRHETAVLERLAGVEGVPRLAAVPAGAGALALQDTGGVPLATMLSAERLDVAALLELAVDLADVVAGVHRRGVVHKDINPANIVVPGGGHSPVLIDFDLATTFAEERPGFTHESVIAGTLAYLAPEQSGRTGRPVDQRADLYALGVTLYELATGRLPFAGTDPLQLVHDHLTRVPVSPAVLNPALPPGLSAVIERLMEKEPDRRYQSAEGLSCDLTRVREELGRGGSTLFPLGERDFPLRLAAPSRLVGRELEIEALRAAFEEAVGGGSRGVLIAGAPGVGKTALIDELRPIAAAGNGWFVTGKFDQHRRDMAADAVHQALRALGRLLLAEPEAELAAHRERLSAGLGVNAGLITAAVPEFALLLGAAPQPSGSDPVEAEGRLIRAGLDLLRAVTSPARPVVLVLDDLQWAPPTPIGFIDAVLTDEQLAGLLVVGAYRDGEVDPTHPLSARLARWQRLGVAPGSIRLENLPPADLGTLLAQMLRLPPGEAARLAEEIGTRTAGNPYDTVELVNALRQDGVLTPSGSGWSWAEGAVRRHVGHGDVIAVLAARMDRLPAQTQRLLEVMACLGGEVEYELLTVAAGLPPATLAELLAPALEDGLLLMAHHGSETVRFRHDRVQQAAYGRLEPAPRRELHLTLARRLAAHAEFAAMAAEQYLPAFDALADQGERRRVAELFRGAAAGVRLTDYPTAERFLGAATELLSTGEAADAALLVAVETERHAALYGLGRLDEADEVYASIERRNPDPLDLAEAAWVQLRSLANRGQAQQALALGLDLLARLELPVPEDLGAAVFGRLDALARWATESGQTPDVRPESADRRALAVAKVINSALMPALVCDPLVNAWLCLESQSQWVEHAPAAPLLATFALAPTLFIALRQDYRSGYDLARHVLVLGEARGYELETRYAQANFACTVGPWFEPLETIPDHTRQAREGLLRGGDLQFACFTYTSSIAALLDSAPTLDTCSAEVEAGLAFAARTGNDHSAGAYLAYRQLLRSLRGETNTPGGFADASFDEAAHLAAAGHNPVAAVMFHVHRALSAALFDDPAGLDRHAAAAMPLLPYVPGFYCTALAYLLRALALAERVRTGAAAERDALLAELDGCRHWLALRAADAPGNFAHLRWLVEAERAGSVGDFEGALRAFDQARHAAGAGMRPWHQALIAERAARFHLRHGLEHTGRALLGQARRRYDAWGASAKVGDLDRKYPYLRTLDGDPHDGDRAGTGSVGTGTSTVSLEAMDLLAVLQASQALAGESNLERLRARIVEVVGAMTGATTVRLLLWNDDARSWFLPGTGEDGDAPLAVAEAGDLGLLPLSAFRYADRTREPLLVADATRDDRFARDPYLADLDHCSLLVVPILTQGAPRAMLLLENRLSRSAFTPDRLDAVMLIAGQLAVSLDNALAERFRALVQRSSELTLVCDRAGVLSYASAASTDILGLEDRALTGRPVTELVHPDDRPALAERIAHAGRAEAQNLECRVVSPDGSVRWVEVTFTDLLADPAVGGLVLHLRDVTDRRQLEAELRHAQKLESVGQLAAGIAHEINTPIQFIGDNVRFLRDAFADLNRLTDAYLRVQTATDSQAALAEAHRAAEESDHAFFTEEIPAAIDQTLEGVDRVATIVRAMKAFGHPSEQSKAPADLNEAIRNTLVVATSEIKYVADVVTDLGELPPVWCNLGDINQVVLNLVVNAAQAMRETVAAGGRRGTLTVRTRRDGDDVVLEVQDTGAGIPAEIAERVFEPFFTTKEVGKGTGQGLALAYSLVHDRHDGGLTFTSEPGVGTTFTVRLPHGPPPGASTGA